MTRRYTKEQVLQAISKSYHNRTTIASRLGCDWHTADRFIKKWEETKRAFEDEKETINDVAEGKAFQLIMDKDGPMIRWWLSKMGKDRGYGDDNQDTEPQLEAAGAPALRIEIVDAEDTGAENGTDTQP